MSQLQNIIPIHMAMSLFRSPHCSGHRDWVLNKYNQPNTTLNQTRHCNQPDTTTSRKLQPNRHYNQPVLYIDITSILKILQATRHYNKTVLSNCVLCLSSVVCLPETVSSTGLVLHKLLSLMSMQRVNSSMQADTRYILPETFLELLSCDHQWSHM